MELVYGMQSKDMFTYPALQERCNSITNALELRLSCTNLSICIFKFDYNTVQNNRIQWRPFIARFIIANILIELNIDKSTVHNMLPFELTKDTPYLALSGELWSVFYEYFNRNWSCYKGFLLYCIQHHSDFSRIKICVGTHKRHHRVSIIMIMSISEIIYLVINNGSSLQYSRKISCRDFYIMGYHTYQQFKEEKVLITKISDALWNRVWDKSYIFRCYELDLFSWYEKEHLKMITSIKELFSNSSGMEDNYLNNYLN